MAIPGRYEVMPTILAALVDGRVWSSSALQDRVAVAFKVTADERVALRKNSTSLIPEFANEHAWALVYLQNRRYTRTHGELITQTDGRQGFEAYKITDVGEEAVRDGLTFSPASAARPRVRNTGNRRRPS